MVELIKIAMLYGWKMTYTDVLFNIQRWLREEHNLSVEITWDCAYEYDEGKWADAIWSIHVTDIKDGIHSFSPSWQRRSGEQFEYEPTLIKGLMLATKSLKK